MRIFTINETRATAITQPVEAVLLDWENVVTAVSPMEVITLFSDGAGLKLRPAWLASKGFSRSSTPSDL